MWLACWLEWLAAMARWLANCPNSCWCTKQYKMAPQSLHNRATFVWPWKSVRNEFHGPMFGKIKTKLLLIPANETPNMGSKQYDCPITLLHFKWRQAKCRSLSRTFHGEMTLFASAFAKPMKIRARLFLFDKPINCSAFLFTFCFHVYFSRSYESCSNSVKFPKDILKHCSVHQHGRRDARGKPSIGRAFHRCRRGLGSNPVEARILQAFLSFII